MKPRRKTGRRLERERLQPRLRPNSQVRKKQEHLSKTRSSTPRLVERRTWCQRVCLSAIYIFYASCYIYVNLISGYLYSPINMHFRAALAGQRLGPCKLRAAWWPPSVHAGLFWMQGVGVGIQRFHPGCSGVGLPGWQSTWIGVSSQLRRLRPCVDCRSLEAPPRSCSEPVVVPLTS